MSRIIRAASAIGISVEGEINDNIARDGNQNTVLLNKSSQVWWNNYREEECDIYVALAVSALRVGLCIKTAMLYAIIHALSLPRRPLIRAKTSAVPIRIPLMTKRGDITTIFRRSSPII
jgi:hypothetical protein